MPNVLSMLSVTADANWWEPGTTNLFDVGDLSAILGLIALGSGMIFGITKWWMRIMKKMMREEISAATAPIQPSANGGLSLPDVARRTEKLEKQMDIILDTQTEMNGLLIKVISQSVMIPDTPAAVEPKMTRSRSKKNS